jgi:hypothetical protein
VQCFHIGVDKQCRMKVLKHLQTRYQTLRYRAVESHSSNKGPGSSTNGYSGKKLRFTEHIPQKLWDMPPMLEDWWRDNKKHGTKSAEIFGCELLALVASVSHAGESGIRIEVTNKNNLTACFAVDMKRTAYFFKDRDVVLTPKGKPARIFHIVRPYTYMTKTGREVVRNFSFRGLRSFDWGPYHVHLTVPGLHHTFITSDNLPAMMDSEAAKGLGLDLKDTIYNADFGRVLRHIVHGENELARELLKERRERR